MEFAWIGLLFLNHVIAGNGTPEAGQVNCIELFVFTSVFSISPGRSTFGDTVKENQPLERISNFGDTVKESQPLETL